MGIKIKKNVCKDIVNVYPYYIEHFDHTLSVSIKYLNENTMATLNKKAKSGKYVKHQWNEEVDTKLLAKLIVAEALVNIENMVWNDLRFLIEPDVPLELEGNKWTDPAIFCDEVKEIIAEKCNHLFYGFIMAKSRDTEAIAVNVLETENKNLQTGSGTAKVHN